MESIVVDHIELGYDENNEPTYQIHPSQKQAAQRWFWDWEDRFLDDLRTQGALIGEVRRS